MIDYEKLLRAYIQHVVDYEGTDFLGSCDASEFAAYGLSEDEGRRLIDLGDDVAATRRKAWEATV